MMKKTGTVGIILVVILLLAFCIPDNESFSEDGSAILEKQDEQAGEKPIRQAQAAFDEISDTPLPIWKAPWEKDLPPEDWYDAKIKAPPPVGSRLTAEYEPVSAVVIGIHIKLNL